MPQIAKVAVAAATYAIDKPYDYLVPQGADMAVGMRVLVPFGRGNRVSEGVVLTLGQGVPEKPIKPIRSLVDREPVITEREIRLALWMRERYFCTFYDAIRTILPAAVWYSYREMWSLTGEPLPEDLSERETAACRLLQDGPMERDDLCAALGETGSRVLAGLKKRGILQMEPQGTRKVQDKVVQIAALSLAPQEALRQMERKKKSAARQYDASTQTGSEVLDVVLTEKSMLCEAHHISINNVADGTCLHFMDPADLYALFANALDHAIELTRKLPEPEKRMIDLLVCRRQGFAVLNIISAVPDGPDPGRETCDELKIIKRIIQKYNGFLTTESNGGFFAIKAVFPVQ